MSIEYSSIDQQWYGKYFGDEPSTKISHPYDVNSRAVIQYKDVILSV